MDFVAPTVQVQMLIRRPIASVFNAFVDPRITTQFWFTHASGPLEVGRLVRWEWAMYGVSTLVQVQALEPPQRIALLWDDPPCPVEWQFSTPAPNTTLVQIRSEGFAGPAPAQLSKALEVQGGFATVLAGLKAWMEHGLHLRLVDDQFPQSWVQRAG